MLTFTDSEKRQWTLRLTAYAIARVRERTGLDLFAVLDDWPGSAGKLSGDPALFVHAVYLLATAPKDAPQVSDEDFARAVDGETLDAMTDAFHAAVLDFFRQSPRGPALAKVREKAEALQALLAKRLLARAEAMDPEKVLARIEAEAEAKGAAPSKSDSGDSPALRAWTPDPSPSAS